MTAPTTQEPRTTLGWTNAMAQALEMEDIDSKGLFEKAGIPYQSMTNPTCRIETRKTSKLFQLALEATQNPAFGIKVANYIQPSTLHALGFSLYSSSTLYDFCRRLERYFRLLSDDAQHFLREDNDAYCLEIKITNSDVCFETVDAYVCFLVQTCRNIYHPSFSPLRIELRRPPPHTHREDFERFFKAPVSFSTENNAIYFDKTDMVAPLPAADSELARRNDEVVIEHLSRLDRSDIVRQVEAKIVELLPTGDCSKEKIASELNMSLSKLYNKLEQKKTTYQKILEELRSGLARQYIEQKNMPISQVTYLLGFSDTSNFSRAFRRWTGQSPSSYRSEKQKKGE